MTVDFVDASHGLVQDCGGGGGGGAILGAPIMRIVILEGLYWGPPIQGNDPILHSAWFQYTILP